MLAALIASGTEIPTSRGDSGIGPVIIVVALTVGAALVLTWIVKRLPDWGAGSRWDPLTWGRRSSPRRGVREDPDERPPSGPIER